MRQKTLLAVALVALASTVYAQDLTGDWQGTLRGPRRDLRIVLRITKTDRGNWNATLFSIDQNIVGVPTRSVTVKGSRFKFEVEPINGSYKGMITADGAIDGTWREGEGRPAPLVFHRATSDIAFPEDRTPHSAQFVTVDNNVKLEVLDWGGLGRPLVLLAGLGGTAHGFDQFALKLIPSYHVYGITRRGFGASSSPAPEKANYAPDRLGDDVLAVVDALQLKNAVLVGQSIAGQELSSVGSRHPEKVGGLIYLDAGYVYAYWDRSKGKFPSAHSAKYPASPLEAILAGRKAYSDIPVRTLAFFAAPHALRPDFKKDDPDARARAEAEDLADTGAQAAAFAKGVRSALVVRLPHADHNVIQSNERDVLREMNLFLGSLP
jgi:pimeloyl-ACP methyl ester carboxylesterase